VEAINDVVSDEAARRAVRTLEDVLAEEYPGESLDIEALRVLIGWAKPRLARP
jgi:hypothetical protein